MISSLRQQIMLAGGLLAIAAIVAVALAARQHTRSEFRRFQFGPLSVSPNVGGEGERIAAFLGGRCCDSTKLRAAANALSAQQALIIIDESNKVIAKSGKPIEGIGEIRLSRNGEGVSIEATHQKGAVHRRVNLSLSGPGTPLTMANGDPGYLYVVPFPKDEIKPPDAAFFVSLDRFLLFFTALTVVIVLLGAWVLTERIVRPIEDLRMATSDLAQGRLWRRVEMGGSREITELGHGFNAMAMELEKQHLLRRNLVHDVAHELRTPLAALRCRLDSMTDGVSPDPHKEIIGANEEIEHLARLVEDLHELALAEARELKFEISEVPLRPIVESAVRAAGLDVDPRLRIEVDQDLMIHGDAVRLRQIVLNLLSNAARYTPQQGTITVYGYRAGETLVEIQNTGSQLTSDELTHVFDRFYRTDPSRQRATGGTGLGLAIVKNLVEAQGGRIWAQSDEVGVTFSFALPA